jgi:MEMO1 family protein
MDTNVRKPAVAGSFYPDDRDSLSDMVEGFIGSANISKKFPATAGIIVPHAGYVYSGKVAGYGFAAIKDMDFDTAILIGSGHHEYVKGAGLYSDGYFETPLGKVTIDSDFCNELKESSKLFKDDNKAHKEEHSLEAQLPFLQNIAPKAKIVPILINSEDNDVLREIGHTIAKVAKNKRVVIVISSDLSHYPSYGTAVKTDKSVLTAIKIAHQRKSSEYLSLATETLMLQHQPGLATVCCGQSAIIAGMYALLELGANSFDILKYANSGDESGDMDRVVGYGSGVFFKDNKPKEFPLSSAEEKELLKLARSSIEHYLENQSVLPVTLSKRPVFNLPFGVFVTIQKNGDLRGCIGNMEPINSLQNLVVHMALSSAFEDPRFPSINKEELREVKIEISVLSPLRQIKSVDEIIQNKHGVLIRKGNRGGTYLPQVWEHFDSKEEFLNSLCYEKAGLSKTCWKNLSDSDMEAFIYTVQSFSE